MSCTRQKFVKQMQAWVGLNEGNGSHKKIVDIYNTIKPLPVGYKLKYTDEWCAGTVSAAAQECGATDIIPVECSCPRMVTKAKKMGIWVERDDYVPKPGDLVLYDWADSGKGDNKGDPDHVGAVEKVVGSTITVIEGNYSNSVKRRPLEVNGKNIRGFIAPKYDEDGSKTDKGTTDTGTNASTGSTNTGTSKKDLAFGVGDVVQFTGSKHYANANATTGPACKAGKAKVTAISKGAKHPYHLVRVSGAGSTVYGWVDADDVKACSTAQTINVGDMVQFTGSKHYANANASTGPACKPGKAKVTAISKGAKHPYHLVRVNGAGSTVYGWVDADKVSK